MRFFPIKKLYLPASSIVAVGFLLLVLISISTYRNLNRQKAMVKSHSHRGDTIIFGMKRTENQKILPKEHQ